MKKMRWDFTLPEFQEKLDGLADGTLFQISGRDCERLFGTNDVAVARLKNFAKGQACVVNHSNGDILYRKHFAQQENRI